MATESDSAPSGGGIDSLEVAKTPDRHQAEESHKSEDMLHRSSIVAGEDRMSKDSSKDGTDCLLARYVSRLGGTRPTGIT